MFSKTLTYNGPFIVEIIQHSLSLLCLELIFQFGNNFKTFVFASSVVSKKRHPVFERNCVGMYMYITQWLAAIQLNDFQHFISSRDFSLHYNMDRGLSGIFCNVAHSGSQPLSCFK